MKNSITNGRGGRPANEAVAEMAKRYKIDGLLSKGDRKEGLPFSTEGWGLPTKGRVARKSGDAREGGELDNVHKGGENRGDSKAEGDSVPIRERPRAGRDCGLIQTMASLQ